MNSPTGTILRLEGVSKRFGPTVTADDLSLEVKRGEFFTFLGPSGSGKSTILRMVAGLEQPDSGLIEIDGRDVSGTSPWNRELGMMFQQYAIFPHMTVAQNVAYGLKVRNWDADLRQKRVTEMLHLVGLAGIEGKNATLLSGGEQQRVALARALAPEPKMLLLDEPLSALDERIRRAMQNELKRVHAETGTTFLYVTHDQEEALTMSDRIAVFNDGAIYQLDTPDGLYEKPENSFVAQFIGENNQLHGRVAGMDPGLCEVELDGGGRVKALPVKVEGVGSRTLVSIRPERIVMEPEEMKCENEFRAKVDEMIYKGEYTTLRIRLAEGTAEMTVKMPVSRKAGDVKVGSTIRVGWLAEDCRALDEPHA